jgi:hypothetical protein
VAASCVAFFSRPDEDTHAALACLRKVQSVRMRFFEEQRSRLWALFPGNAFDYSVTWACGIDMAHAFMCRDYALGRLGIWLFSLLCHICFLLLRRPERVKGTMGGVHDRQSNDAMLEHAHAILPGLVRTHKDTRLVGLRTDLFAELRQEQHSQ